MWTNSLKKLYQKSLVLVNQMAVAAIPLVIMEEESRGPEEIFARVLKILAMAGGVYLLAKTFFGEESIANAKGWDAIKRPLQIFAGAAIALFFASDLIAESLFGVRLGNLILDLLK